MTTGLKADVINQTAMYFLGTVAAGVTWAVDNKYLATITGIVAILLMLSNIRLNRTKRLHERAETENANAETENTRKSTELLEIQIAEASARADDVQGDHSG